MEDASLAVSNLTLAIVDTPGFFDGNGEKQDKENLKTVLQYKKERLGNYYPNLIIITIQVEFKDNFG